MITAPSAIGQQQPTGFRQGLTTGKLARARIPCCATTQNISPPPEARPAAVAALNPDQREHIHGKRPRSLADLQNVPPGMACLLTDLFASMPEIDDLYAEVVGGPPAWILVAYDQAANIRPSFRNATPTVGSTYGLFLDSSGKVPVERLENAGWPLAEICRLDDKDHDGTVFRARVDHAGHHLWWRVLPTHSSPFGNSPALLFPTIGGLREYRTIAAVTLYALSIMARYRPGAWRRIEGGDQDHYLALVKASVAVWERLLPEHFLQSIAGETIRTVQPGSIFA